MKASAVAFSCLAFLFTAPAAHGAMPLEAGSFAAASYLDGGNCKYAPLGDCVNATLNVRAGAHPAMSATRFTFQSHLVGTGYLPDGSVKDVVLDLPPGFIGNPTATPRCDQERLVQVGFCPNSTAVGLAYLPVLAFPFGSGGSNPTPSGYFAVPVYNLQPSFGEPALFGFYIENPSFVTLIHFSLDPTRNYAIDAAVKNASGIGTIYSSRLAVWGVPAAGAHDKWRGYRKTAGGTLWDGCLKSPGGNDNGPESWGETCAGPTPVKPFVTNPATCNGQPALTSIALDSWQEPGRFDAEGNPDLSDPAWSTDVAEAPPVEGCENLEFGGPAAPVTLTLQPSVRTADSPSGYEAKLNLPFNEDPEGLAAPTLRDTTTILPDGVVVNPSSANGLGACTSAQIGVATPLGQTPIRFNGQPAQCPNSSKIGAVQVKTPLIEHTLSGSVYLAKQFDNPLRSLLAIYIVVEDPETGTIIKLPGHVEADKVTGRLKTTFTENPQLPFTELDLDFFGGPGASLMNPLTCGARTTTSMLTPSSAPQTPAVTYQDAFQVGAGCVGSEVQAPNAPSFEAGTTFTNAGAFSPFVLKLTRSDGSQRLSAINLSLPPGLTGKLAGVPYCPEAAIAQARSRSKPGEGALEQVNPSCPAASQVGTVTVGAGAGSQPYYTQGKAYLAGPYKGAPLSMVIVTPAVAGPFDLGTVVVRTALYVDPETARISAKSDPLPTILEGIPLDVRSITLSLDRPDFTLNPTSCEAMLVSGEAISTTGNVAALQNRFQVGGCRGLKFEPRLALRVFGKTNRSANPRFRAVLQMKSGEANIARAQVNLPHSEFLEQAHIRTVCTRVQFAQGIGNGSACPAGSIYGHAKAWSPLLDQPLEGPVFLRSNGGERNLPDLVAALDGQIQIALWGKVDSGSNKGIRNTFEVVPDAPVSKFILEMKGGKRGLLVNSENLCSPKVKDRAIARFVAQSGAVASFKPRVANSCRKSHKRAHQTHQRRSKRASLSRLRRFW